MCFQGAVRDAIAWLRKQINAFAWTHSEAIVNAKLEKTAFAPTGSPKNVGALMF